MKYAVYNNNGFIIQVLSKQKPETGEYYTFTDETEVNYGDILVHPDIITPDLLMSKKHLIELLYKKYAIKILTFMSRSVTPEESSSWILRIDEIKSYEETGVLPPGGILESFDSYRPWSGAIDVSIDEYILNFKDRMDIVLPLMGKLEKCLQAHLKTIPSLNSKEDVIHYNLDIGWPI